MSSLLTRRISRRCRRPWTTRLRVPSPAAIIVRRPCLLIKRLKHDVGKCVVDREKCRGCKVCLKVACPALHMVDGKTEIDQTLCAGCKVCAQACPFGAISRIGEQEGE